MFPRTQYMVLLVAFSLSCSEPKATGPQMSRTPASIRGWIRDIETPETEFYRLTKSTAGAGQFRIEQFRATTVYVENAPFASGGVAENGSFIILDVPPGTNRILFSSPGVPSAAIELQDVPPNADVLLPSVNVTKTGATLVDPRAVVVRVPDKIAGDQIFKPLLVQGQAIPVRKVPVSELIDRRDYPGPK